MNPDNQSTNKYSAGQESGNRCLVVMYHYVRPRTANRSEGIHGPTPEEFRSQVQELTRHLDPISYVDFAAWQRGDVTLPTDAVLFTFDDGLKDHATFAAPILDQFGISGLFFVAGNTLAHRAMLTAHAIHLLMATIGAKAFSTELQNALEKNREGASQLNSEQESRAIEIYHYESPAIARLKYLLNFELSPGEACAAVSPIFEQHVGDLAHYSEKTYLSWDDLVALEGRGHTIGAHGFSHDPYLRIPESERGRDICQIADLLKDGLGLAQRPISYPFGSVDPTVADLCARAGFNHGFTTRHAWATSDDNAMLIPRIDANRVDAEVQESQPCL